jgi:hypothetical protein
MLGQIALPYLAKTFSRLFLPYEYQGAFLKRLDVLEQKVSNP